MHDQWQGKERKIRPVEWEKFVNFRTWLHVPAILDLGVKTLNKYLKQRKILSIIADVASTRV